MQDFYLTQYCYSVVLVLLLKALPSPLYKTAQLSISFSAANTTSYTELQLTAANVPHKTTSVEATLCIQLYIPV